MKKVDMLLLLLYRTISELGDFYLTGVVIFLLHFYDHPVGKKSNSSEIM